MAKNRAPHAAMVRLRNVSTGEIIERWPVDARGMIACGEFVAASDLPAQVSPPLSPPPSAAPLTPTTTTDHLGAQSYKELQALAKRAGINANQKMADLIAALVPLVDAGTVSLEVVPKVAIDPVQFPHANEA